MLNAIFVLNVEQKMGRANGKNGSNCMFYRLISPRMVWNEDGVL